MDGWKRMIYDLAGRVTEVATFSGSPTTTPPTTGTNANWTGSVSTSYNGTATTVTDEAGKKRRTIEDAFDNLIRVDEPNENNELGELNNPNQATIYDYDIRNNLIQITQGGQTRSFTYNSLSRLKSATNPESGTFQFSYDANGNLLTKIDARGISTKQVSISFMV